MNELVRIDFFKAWKQTYFSHDIDQKKVEKEYHCELDIPQIKWRVSWNYT